MKYGSVSTLIRDDLMDELGEILSEIRDFFRLPINLLIEVGIADDEGISHTLIRISNQEPLLENTIKEITILVLQPATTSSASLLEITTVCTILVTLHTESPLLPVLEGALESGQPLLLGQVIVLDRSLTVQHPVGPSALHHPNHLILGLRMRDSVECPLALVGIRSPTTLKHRQNLSWRERQANTIQAMSHSLHPIPEVVILPIREMLMEKDLAFEFKAAEEGVALEVGLVLHEDVVLDLASGHPSIENVYNRTELHFRSVKL